MYRDERRVLLVTVTFVVLTFPIISIFVSSPGFAGPLLLYTGLSLIPGLLIVGFVWFTDGTLREPLVPLVVTFLLGAVLSGVAGIINSSFYLLDEAGTLALFVMTFLVVAPGEEIVKIAAVRVYAYKTDHFSAVIDGAVYGAAAGLGFAAAENVIYIFDYAEVVGIGLITAERALAGPGHVVYTAIVGYYLGLAKYNSDNAGPIVCKGLIIAILFHGVFNFGGLFVGDLILVVDIVAFAYLGWLLWRYRNAYRSAYEKEPAPLEPKGALIETGGEDAEEQIQLLTVLYQEGVFTDEEFDEKREAVMEQD